MTAGGCHDRWAERTETGLRDRRKPTGDPRPVMRLIGLGKEQSREADLGWKGGQVCDKSEITGKPPFDESNREQTIWAARCQRLPPSIPGSVFDTRAVAVFSTVMVWYTKRKADMKKDGVAVRETEVGQHRSGDDGWEINIPASGRAPSKLLLS
ncbi:unnamed protein product [Gadus morhua 'NCC']